MSRKVAKHYPALDPHNLPRTKRVLGHDAWWYEEADAWWYEEASGVAVYADPQSLGSQRICFIDWKSLRLALAHYDAKRKNK